MCQSVSVGTILSNGSVSLSGQLPYELSLTEKCGDLDAILENSIFDLNHAFEATDDSLCLPYTTLGRKVSQLDAAREVAK